MVKNLEYILNIGEPLNVLSREVTKTNFNGGSLYGTKINNT